MGNIHREGHGERVHTHVEGHEDGTYSGRWIWHGVHVQGEDAYLGIKRNAYRERAGMERGAYPGRGACGGAYPMGRGVYPGRAGAY